MLKQNLTREAQPSFFTRLTKSGRTLSVQIATVVDFFRGIFLNDFSPAV